jgi:hypothetical protein
VITQGSNKTTGGLNERQRIAAELLNDAVFLQSSDARFILRITAVEALCPQGPSPTGCRRIVEPMLAAISEDGSEDAKAVRQLLTDRLERQSVRSACRDKIKALLGAGDWRVFDTLYGQRSKFLHEGAEAGALGDAAERALEIATKLLLADIAAND